MSYLRVSYQFEGGFSCLKKSVNEDIHPDWITEENGDWVTLRRTDFETVLQTISDLMQRLHGRHILERKIFTI